MRVTRNLSVAAGACALAATAAFALPAGAPLASSVSTARTSGTGTAFRGTSVVLHPGVLQPRRARSAGPPTTAQCERAYRIACYEPGQIRQAYSLPALYRRGINGSGATIVVVDPFGSPTIKHDLGVFDRAFGYPAPPSFRIITPAGKIPPYDPYYQPMVDWAAETTLDVEWAHAIAPRANVVLAETPASETEGVTGFPQVVTAEKYVISHHLGDVISQSFSTAEQTFPSRAALEAVRGAYQDAYRHHVTVLAASGDSGATDVGPDGMNYYTHPVTNWPPSDPLVTGVGGTQLHLNAKGDRTAPDNVWNDTYNKATNEFLYATPGPFPLAGGGGKSVIFGQAYQNGVRRVVGNHRGVPDISMSAACNGGVDTYQSFGGDAVGWRPDCGTSEATPLFAGIVALADQVAGHPLGLINPALYELSAVHAPGIVDITSGSNTVSFTSLKNGNEYTIHGFRVRRGYDLASGVGTINAAYFVPELAFLAGHGHW